MPEDKPKQPYKDDGDILNLNLEEQELSAEDVAELEGTLEAGMKNLADATVANCETGKMSPDPNPTKDTVRAQVLDELSRALQGLSWEPPAKQDD